MEQQESGGSLSEMNDKFLRLKEIDDTIDDLEAKKKTLEQERAELEEKLVAAMDDTLTSRITVAGTTFFRRIDSYPKMKDQEEGFKWLQSIERGDLIKPTVNAQSLRSLVLELQKDNVEIPACIEVFKKNRVQTRSR